jgi:hypothetical protein
MNSDLQISIYKGNIEYIFYEWFLVLLNLPVGCSMPFVSFQNHCSEIIISYFNIKIMHYS